MRVDKIGFGKKVIRTVLRPLYKRVKPKEAAQEASETLQKNLQSNPIEKTVFPIKSFTGTVNSQIVSGNGNVLFHVRTKTQDGKTISKTLECFVLDNKTFSNMTPAKHGEFDRFMGQYKGTTYDKYMEGEHLSQWTPDITRVKLSSVEGQNNLFKIENAQRKVVDYVQYVSNDTRKLIFDVEKDLNVSMKTVDVSPDELVKKIADNYEHLDREVKNLRILKDDGRILSPKVEKHRTSPIDNHVFKPERKVDPKYFKDSPINVTKNPSGFDDVKISPKEITERFVTPDSKHFEQAKQEFIAVRNGVIKNGNFAEITPEKVLNHYAPETLHPYKYTENGKTYETTLEAIMPKEETLEIVPQKAVRSVVGEFIPNKETAEVIAKLVREDLSSLNSCSKSTIRILTENYSKKFARYSLNKPELINSASKRLKNCSFAEFLNVLAEAAPKKVQAVKEMNFKGNLVDLIIKLTGRTSVNPTTKLVDVLQYL